MTVGTVVVAIITSAMTATTVAMEGTVVVVEVVTVVTPTRRVICSRCRGPSSASTPTPKWPLRGVALHPTVLAF
jgi:hypothetical protein